MSDKKTMGLRIWEHIKPPSSKAGFIFTLMSYNVLAQDLLEKHPHLYRKHNPVTLEWETRWYNLLNEIKKFIPDVCTCINVYIYIPDLHYIYILDYLFTRGPRNTYSKILFSITITR